MNAPVQCRSATWWLFAFAIATFITRGAVAWADPASLLAADVLLDDSFYYLKVARNFVDGRGLTFDGVEPTNGFQPLLFLLLIPLLHVVPNDVESPLRALEGLLTVVSVGITCMLFVLGRRLAGLRAAITLAALALLSPALLTHSMNGLETPLALLGLLLALWSWTRDVGPDGCTGSWGTVRMGLLLGLAVLARVDLGLLAASFAMVAIVRGWRKRRLAAVCGRWILVTVVAVAAVTPWLWFSHRQCGALLPQSGSAGRAIALHFGWANLTPIWSDRPADQLLFDPDHPPAEYFADVATQQMAVVLHEHPLSAPLRLDSPSAAFPDVRRSRVLEHGLQHPRTSTTVLAALLALGCGVLVWRSRRDRVGIGGVSVLFAILCCAGYVFFAPVHWYYPRYLLTPMWATAIALVGWVLSAERRTVFRWLGNALAVLWVGSQAALWFDSDLSLRDELSLRRLRWRPSEPRGFLAAYELARDRIPEHRTLGAFQAGTYSWFGQRDVVNLDGKVNASALRAIEAGRLHEYLVKRRVDLLFDWEWVTHCLLQRRTPPSHANLLRPLLRGRHAHEPSLHQVRWRPLRDQ